MVETLWQEFLKILYAEVGSRIVETWFKAVSLVRWDAHSKVVYLKAPNSFVKDWIYAHYRHLFVEHLGRLLNETALNIVFIDEETPKNNTESQPKTSSQDNSHQNSATHARNKSMHAEKAEIATSTENGSRTTRTTLPSRNGINQQYQFDSFVVGPSNALAFAAACAVTEKPGHLYNPLLICGGSGLGKTHLLQAIGNHIKQADTKAHVLYQSGDRFVNEFITAARHDRIAQFEARYKGVDVLLMDDIQCISNKEHTQEMFFHIFTTLYQANKQIVFTSDVLPRDIPGFPDRIRSRLEGGLIADLQETSLQTRIAIIHKKAAAHNIELSEEVIQFIASRIDSNIRDLEGALIRIMAFASLTRQTITKELVYKVLSYRRQTERAAPDMQQVIKVVAKEFNYTLTELKSPKRSKELTLARHIAIYLVKKLTECSLREIAAFFGRKDHSTVIHALEKIEEHKKNQNELATLLEKLEAEIIRS